MSIAGCDLKTKNKTNKRKSIQERERVTETEGDRQTDRGRGAERRRITIRAHTLHTVDPD